MKLSNICTVALAVAALTSFAAEPVITADARLKDGSTIKGEFVTKSIEGSTLFAPKLSLDPATIRSLSFTGTNGEAKVELTNSDRFAIKVANDKFALYSLLGDLAIPRANFRSIAFSKCGGAGNSADGLIFHCTFDDIKALESPEVGPAVKLQLGNIVSNKGKNKGALFVNPGVAGAEVSFPKGYFGPEGCIEFWANMASGKTEFSTGGDPRFFILEPLSGTEVAHLEFASNNGCGNSGFGGHLFGFRAQTNVGFTYMMPYSAVFKGDDYNGWHHYAFVWTDTSLSIFIDGKKVATNNGSINTKAFSEIETIMSIPLNRTRGKSFNNKSAFYMDDLKIWNYAKTTFDL